MCKTKDLILDLNYIKALNKFFNDNLVFSNNKSVDIVQWRNQTIGHGALAFDNDDVFKLEFKCLLKVIASHFRKWENIYNSIKIYVDKDNTCLIGRDKAKNCNLENSNLYLQIDDKKLNLNPFLLLWEKQIYIFDAFIYKNDKYDMLSYPIGKKKEFRQNELEKELKDIYAKCNKVLMHKEYDKSESSAEDSAFLAVINYYLNKDKEKFYKIDFLDEWLKDCLKSEERIFMLMMERGMGKTYWVKRITGTKSFAGDTIFKVIYLNDTYRSRKNSIISKIDQIMNTDENHKIIFDDGNNKHINLNSRDIKQEITDFFKYYINLYKKEHIADKIVLVLDGIDEAVMNISDNIFDFIPSSAMLPENFYILLTCRDAKELNYNPDIFLKELGVSGNNKLIINRQNDNYKQVLCKYIDENIKDINIHELLDKADYRFAYVSILVKVIENTPTENRESILKEHNIIKPFIEMVEKNYSPKYAECLYDILYNIAIAPEPLTIKELSYLLGDNKISFGLLGFINDLKGILKFERSYTYNKISLANDIYMAGIFEILEEKDPDINIRNSNRAMDLFKDIYNEFVSNGEDIEGDGQTYLILNLNQYYNNDYYNEDVDSYIDFDLFAKTFNLAEKYIKKFSYEDTKRGYEIIENAGNRNYDVSKYSNGDPMIEELLIEHIQLIVQYKLLFRWQDLYKTENVENMIGTLISDCNVQFSRIEKIEYKNNSFLKNIVEDLIYIYIKTCMQYGDYYYINKLYKSAKAYYLGVMEMMELQYGKDKPLEYIDLLNSLHKTCDKLGQKKEAKKYLTAYMELVDSLDKENISILNKDKIICQEFINKLYDNKISIKEIEEEFYKLIDYCEEQIKKYSENEYYNICNAESAAIAETLKYLLERNIDGNLELVNKIKEVMDNLRRRNFQILAGLDIILAYNMGVSSYKAGDFVNAKEASITLQQLLAELNDKDESVFQLDQLNLKYFEYKSYIILCNCCVKVEQDMDTAVNYLVRASALYYN